MTEHAEMLKEARELRHLDAEDNAIVRTLIETIKRQDARLAESAKAIFEASAIRAELVVTNSELRAACVTCDEVIGKFIGNRDIALQDKRPGREDWIKLDAARYLAGNAAKLGKAVVFRDSTLHVRSSSNGIGPPVSDADVEATIAEDLIGPAFEQHEEQAEHERSRAEREKAPMVGGQGMPEPPGYSEFRERAEAVVAAGEGLSEKEALAAIDAECAEPAPPIDWERWHGYRDKKGEPLGLTPAEENQYQAICELIMQRHLESATQPAPPIAVEMQWDKHSDDCWSWACNIGGSWISVLGGACPSKADAVARGNAWLAALSDQLDVDLVADWKEGE